MVSYVVVNENTLGYIDDAQPSVLGVLAGSVLKGGHDPVNGITTIHESDSIRPATKEDFDIYRVDPRGHIASMKKQVYDAELLAKTARVLNESDIPNSNPELQIVVGDPDDYRTSPFAQFKPNPGNTQLPNPLSPIEGDEMFFAYMIPGAAFQAKDGSQWNILDYPWQGMVHIENRWYPHISPQVSINDVRRSIEQYIEPVQVFVPVPAPGVDYGAMLVKIVDGPTNYGRPDETSKGEGGYSEAPPASGGW